MTQSASPFDDQPIAPTTVAPVTDDVIFGEDVLDLSGLPEPVTDAECQVHSTARTAFARLGALIEQREAGRPVALSELQIAESDATESILAYKRLLAARAG